MNHKRWQRLQEWEVEAIAQAYLAGEKLSAIAIEFGVNEKSVSAIGLRHGYRRRVIGNGFIQPATEKDFLKLKHKLAAQRRRNVAIRSGNAST